MDFFFWDILSPKNHHLSVTEDSSFFFKSERQLNFDNFKAPRITITEDFFYFKTERQQNFEIFEAPRITIFLLLKTAFFLKSESHRNFEIFEAPMITIYPLLNCYFFFKCERQRNFEISKSSQEQPLYITEDTAFRRLRRRIGNLTFASMTSHKL